MINEKSTFNRQWANIIVHFATMDDNNIAILSIIENQGETNTAGHNGLLLAEKNYKLNIALVKYVTSISWEDSFA